MGEVLIVEDDDSTRTLLSAIVLRNGLQPVEAGDGRECLSLLGAFAFKAILLDLLLPEVTGLEVLAHLHASMPEMLSKVIIITAALEPAWIGASEVRRVRCVIPKPFDVEVLERELLASCEA